MDQCGRSQGKPIKLCIRGTFLFGFPATSISNPCFDPDTFDPEPRRHPSLEIRQLRFLPRRK
jgi:hypothetical protein